MHKVHFYGDIICVFSELVRKIWVVHKPYGVFFSGEEELSPSGHGIELLKNAVHVGMGEMMVVGETLDLEFGSEASYISGKRLRIGHAGYRQNGVLRSQSLKPRIGRR